MASMRQRLNDGWVRWNTEATPGIFLVVTLFGAFVFSTITMAFSALALVGIIQVFGEIPSLAASAIVFLPPLVVLVVWLAYRVRWNRFLFGSVSRP